ncbi:mandelonitrile lyase protein [Dioscorea alata]|uniref:Mandelonitrile lyase protein n=1 Tax=Dioscorea alata TaxID=55571 RepID=A0ACB7UHC6_DIOAL|nr:mandelonitrile lyase protein [Dioscorea alata]
MDEKLSQFLQTLASVLLLFACSSSDASPQQGFPSYMRFSFDAALFPVEAEYDYIVVGGGTAGCPLAATLSEGGHRVLILERGGAPHEFPSLATMDGFLTTISSGSSAPDSPAQTFVSEDGVPNARGRVLGGSSAINAGFYSRAHLGFFHGSGVDPGGLSIEWDMAMVNESYEWVERAVTFRPELRSWQSAVRDGLLEANVTPYNGFTVHHVAGTKIGASTFDPSGQRHSAADLLAFAVPENTRVALRANVDRILLNPIHGGRRRNQHAAIGVIYRDRYGRRHHAMTRPFGEVILCAGALSSPQLLLLSGIGPRAYLSSWGIPVAVHLPEVAQNMADNPRNGISIIPPGPPLDHSLIQVVGITQSNAGDAGPFLEAASNIVPFYSTPRLPPFLHPHTTTTPLYLTVATLIEKAPGPKSFGSLRLASLDSRDNPVVRFNYFSNPDDLAACVTGTRKVAQVLAGRSMDEFRVPPGWFGNGRERRDFRFIGSELPENMDDDASVKDFCRRTVATIWHYHGGCLVGKVVDQNYKVIGVGSLRVIDGSTFSVSPGTNPQATLMMMGRYMGRKMNEERRMMERRRNRRRSTSSPPPPVPYHA